MKCPNCGKEIANDSTFCEYCGTKVETSMPSALRLNWLKWVGVVCLAIGIVLALKFMLNTWWYEGEFDINLSMFSAWSVYMLPVIASFLVGGFSIFKLLDRKMSFEGKNGLFKKLFIWSSIIFALLLLLLIVEYDIHELFEDLYYVFLQMHEEGYVEVYVGVVCLNIWQAKQIVE